MTGVVNTAASDHARCAERSCVLARAREEIGAEGELIADQRGSVDPLPGRVVEEVESGRLLPGESGKRRVHVS